HLGASTEEAQINVAIAVAEQVADALLNRGIRNAVNLPSLDAETYKKMQPWINLAEKVGLFHTQLFEGNIQEVEVSYSGEVAGYNLAPLTIAVLKGLLEPISGALVNFVNAPAFAKERGIAVKESKTTQVEDFANAISLTVKTAQATHAILGTLFGNKDPRIVRVNQYYMDAIPKGYMLVITNEDRPGTVGSIGTLLGKAKINIAEMTLGRDREGAQAMTVINIDQAISPEILKELKSLPHIIDVKLVKL
ncbi:MAG TPA: ACT domain-containing protein, partial [Candidatus Omnitrophota bacterium]|nr:ACT domain-containing protein [Candidatus Omnitrophota bacterium]